MRAIHMLSTIALAASLAGCSGSGLSGWYPVAPGGGTSYGFEFRDGGIVISRAGDTIGRGTFTVDGSRVMVCFGSLCNELTITDGCLVDDDGRYCNEAAQARAKEQQAIDYINNYRPYVRSPVPYRP